MAVTEYLWPVAPSSGAPIAADITVSPFDRPIRLQPNPDLGYGLVRPFARGPSDFSAEYGAALVRSAIGQILGTRAGSSAVAGELPWRSAFGSLLYNLRHRANDEALQGIAQVYVVDALQRWEPRIVLRSVRIEKGSTQNGGENVLTIFVAYDLLAVDSPSNAVFLPNVEQTLEVQL